MGKVLSEISAAEEAFITQQPVFFVATAPLAAQHHVSVSPKAPGAACVRLDNHTVAYADLTGSGAETAAHVHQNGRMTLMFCNLQAGPPKILRLAGTAELLLAPHEIPVSLRRRFPRDIVNSPGFRAVYVLHVNRISTSCGFSLPIMELKKNRTILLDYTKKQGVTGTYNYQTLKNSFSIDGLPSLAQWRLNGPPVVPVLEEGYVHGKVMDAKEEEDSNNNDNNTPNNNNNKKDAAAATATTTKNDMNTLALMLALQGAAAQEKRKSRSPPLNHQGRSNAEMTLVALVMLVLGFLGGYYCAASRRTGLPEAEL